MNVVVNLKISFFSSLLNIRLCLFWLRLWHGDDCCTPIWKILPIMFVLFEHRCKYNVIWCDCHTSERISAIQSGCHSFDVFDHLILPFNKKLSLWIFLGVQYFCDFIFYSRYIIPYIWIIGESLSSLFSQMRKINITSPSTRNKSSHLTPSSRRHIAICCCLFFSFFYVVLCVLLFVCLSISLLAMALSV